MDIRWSVVSHAIHVQMRGRRRRAGRVIDRVGQKRRNGLAIRELASQVRTRIVAHGGIVLFGRRRCPVRRGRTYSAGLLCVLTIVPLLLSRLGLVVHARAVTETVTMT